VNSKFTQGFYVMDYDNALQQRTDAVATNDGQDGVNERFTVVREKCLFAPSWSADPRTAKGR